MASPVMGSLPSAGSVIAAASLAASANTGALIDCSSVWQGQISVRDTTGGTAASTSGLQVSVYYIYAATAFSTGLASGGSSITVSSGTGLARGMKIAIGGANPEVVTIASSYTVGSTTVPITGTTLYNHSLNDPVYLIDQTPFPATLTLGYNLTAANTTYSNMWPLDTGYYFMSLVNTDATNAITVEVTARYITSVQ